MVRYVVVSVLWLAAMPVTAKQWILGQRLEIHPAATMDVTYQSLPDFDPKDKVIVGWTDDEPRYVLSADEQPGGFPEQQYWQSLLNEYQQFASPSIQVIDEGKLTSDYHYAVSYKVLHWQAQGKSYTQVAGLILDQEYAYWVIVQPWRQDSYQDISNEVFQLIQQAKIN